MGNSCKGLGPCPQSEEHHPTQSHGAYVPPTSLHLGSTSGPETLEWLNLCFQSYWPKFNNWAKEFVETSIKADLQRKLPSFLKDHVNISKFTLGKVPPRFSEGRGQHRSTDDARLSFMIDWNSDLTAEITFTHKTLGKVLSLGIKGFKMSGNLSVVLSVQETGPVLSGWGATMYFFDVPNIDIDFTGAANIGDFPGIRGIIREVIEKKISNMMVLPNTATLTFGSANDNAGTNFSMHSEAAPIGCLRVTLLKAQGIKSGDFDFFAKMTGKDNQYLMLKLGGVQWKSNSIDPNTHHTIVCHDVRQSLKIEVWDEDLISADDRIGQAGPFRVKEALALSGTTIQLKPQGSLDVQTTWLKAEPKQLAKDGCIICVKVSSISLPLKEGSTAKLHVQMDAGKTSKEDHSRVVKRSSSRFAASLSALEKAGVPHIEVEALRKANQHLEEKMGLITALYIHATDHELATGTLCVSVLVEKDGKFVTVGQSWSTQLTKVSSSPNLTLNGPMSFGHSITVDANVQLWGLIPGSCDD